MNRSIFWDIWPCSPLKVNPYFGQQCCLLLQCWSIIFQSTSRSFLALLVLWPRIWRQTVPQKCRLTFNRVHSIYALWKNLILGEIYGQTQLMYILCKYLMYIMTDYRLILTKDRPDLSSEREDPSVTALARTSSNSKLQTRPLIREGTTK
jgi:hypothetical protein